MYYYARAGSSLATKGGKLYDIKKTHKHPNYAHDDEKNPRFDIVIIEVLQLFEYTDVIQPIKFIPKEFSHLYENSEFDVSGYGAECYECPSTEQLTYIIVRTLDFRYCKTTYYSHLYLNDTICGRDKDKFSTGKYI